MVPIFLVIMATIIIVLNVKTLRKKENSFEEIVKNKENTITDYEVEVGKLRREFSESLTELQGDIYSLKEELASIKKNLQINKDYSQDNKDNVRNNKEGFEDNRENLLSNKEDIQVNKDNFKVYEENIDVNKEEKAEDNILINSQENNSNNGKNNFEENTLKNEINNDNNIVKLEEEQKESSSNIGFKVNEVHRLMALGLTDDEICETLGIGKGEVLLIKGLYKG